MGEHLITKLLPNFPPPSLITQLMSYHRSHSNSLRLAHIISALPQPSNPPPQAAYSSSSSPTEPSSPQEPAIQLAKGLAPYFSHIQLTHPSPSSTISARQALSQYHAQKWHEARFTFSTAASHDAHLSLARGSVDLCLVLLSDSDADADLDVESRAAAWMAAAREMLTPNGVLAVVRVRPWPVVARPASLQLASRRLRSAMGHWHGGEHGLDWLDIDPRFFYEIVTKRVHINSPPIAAGQKLLPAERTKLRPQERVFDFSGDGDDEEARGWDVEVLVTWFREFVGILCESYLAKDIEMPAVVVETLRDFEAEAGAEDLNNRGETFLLRIGCDIVLTTRNTDG